VLAVFLFVYFLRPSVASLPLWAREFPFVATLHTAHLRPLLPCHGHVSRPCAKRYGAEFPFQRNPFSRATALDERPATPCSAMTKIFVDGAVMEQVRAQKKKKKKKVHHNANATLPQHTQHVTAYF